MPAISKFGVMWICETEKMKVSDDILEVLFDVDDVDGGWDRVQVQTVWGGLIWAESETGDDGRTTWQTTYVKGCYWGDKDTSTSYPRQWAYT